jgi:hypothetical protein
MGVELGDDLGKMLFDDGPGLMDRSGMFGGETDKLGHVTKVFTGIF